MSVLELVSCRESTVRYALSWATALAVKPILDTTSRQAPKRANLKDLDTRGLKRNEDLVSQI